MTNDGQDESHVEVAATAPNEITARMWQELLKSQGIVAALKPAGAGYAFATSMPFEHQILVLAEHVQRARAIIADFEAEDDDSPSSSSPSP